jgi:hypothetical protein
MVGWKCMENYAYNLFALYNRRCICNCTRMGVLGQTRFLLPHRCRCWYLSSATKHTVLWLLELLRKKRQGVCIV